MKRAPGGGLAPRRHAAQIAVNVSARNLKNIELPDLIGVDCAAASNSPPTALTVELTKIAAMGDAAQTMDVLTRFCLKGFTSPSTISGPATPR